MRLAIAFQLLYIVMAVTVTGMVIGQQLTVESSNTTSPHKDPGQYHRTLESEVLGPLGQQHRSRATTHNCRVHVPSRTLRLEPANVFDSPTSSHPMKYRIASMLPEDSGEFKFLKAFAIQQDAPDWELVNWQLGQYHDCHLDVEPIRPVTYNRNTNIIPSTTAPTRSPQYHMKTLHENHRRHFYCVDIGGNHGYFAIHMALHGCHVQVFEIHPTLVDVIAYNAKINHLDKLIHVYHIGLSNRRSSMAISGSMNGLHYLASSTARHDNDSGATVPVLPGDDCIPKRPIALMKIDVEGFEVRTLEGMKGLLSSGLIEAIHIEIAPARWNRAEMDLVEGMATLSSLLQPQYHISIMTNNKAAYCPASQIYNEPFILQTDVILPMAASMRYLTWPAFNKVLETMVQLGRNHSTYNSSNGSETLVEEVVYGCNFYFTKKQPLHELVKSRPIDYFRRRHADRTKFITGAELMANLANNSKFEDPRQSCHRQH